MGVGHEAIAVMWEILNILPPCQPSAWNEHFRALYNANKKAVNQKLASACNFMHELYGKEKPDLTEDDIIEIAVSFDGIWSKRGFSTNFGVGLWSLLTLAKF